MPKDFKLFLELSIKIELTLANLYQKLSELFPADREFWWTLAIEEKNHASLLKTGIEFIKHNKFPEGLLPLSMEALQESLIDIQEKTQSFLNNISRNEAFSMAYEFENSAVELHFQHYMTSEIKDDIQEIFNTLNRSDKDHASRILQYWSKVSIEANM